MKHTKTYEGFFSKSEIPKKLIESVNTELSRNFQVKVERPKIDKDKVLDRVKFVCATKVGPVDLVISLLKSPSRSRIKLVSAAKGMFKENELHVSCYHGRGRYVYSNISMEQIDAKTGELKSIGGNDRIENTLYGYPNNISKYVEYTVNKVLKENKAKKEFENFYNNELIEEIKDLLIDLYDMLGEYKMEKKNVKGRKGFYIEFVNTPKDGMKHIVYTNRIDTDYKSIYFDPSEAHMKILGEIHNLYMRLKEGYGLTLEYNMHAGLKLVILQDKPTEEKPF